MLIRYFTTVPTISTSIYASGDAIGGQIDIYPSDEYGNLRKPCLLQSAHLLDDDKENTTTDLILYKSDPTAVSDNAAYTITAADEDDILGIITFDTYKDFGSHSLAQILNIALPIPPQAAIYGQLVTRGTPTYTATDDLRLSLTFVEY